jgi:hypothetical protein
VVTLNAKSVAPPVGDTVYILIAVMKSVSGLAQDFAPVSIVLLLPAVVTGQEEEQ